MKDYSSFISEKPCSCDVDGCSMKFDNEDHLTVHKKRHDMILTLGLGQKGTTDQTPTPTQFIRNCEEVGLFQDLQNVNPFEETFKKAVEAVKSGQLSLEKSFQASPADDTLHTPNIFPHITDVPNHTDINNKCQNIPLCEEELIKQNDCNSDKNNLRDCPLTNSNTESVLNQTKGGNIGPLKDVNIMKKNFPGDKKIMLKVPEGHLVQLLTPQNSQNSCNMVLVKNTVGDAVTPLSVSVKEKLKKNLNEKKTGKNLLHKVPILKCPIKRAANSNGNKFSKFSKNANKLLHKLEVPETITSNDIMSAKQKKINKIQSKESRSEFLARSRAASSRCREKKKMYLLYLEKINSELSTANQNLVLINSLLRQEISELRLELMKHKNCNVVDESAEPSVMAPSLVSLTAENTFPEVENIHKFRPSFQSCPEIVDDTVTSKNDFVCSDELILSECQSDASLISLDVAEVILNSEPEENEIPLSDGNKPPDIIVRFNSVSNDFPAAIPSDSCIDLFIARAGEGVKQIYGEHSYYLKKAPVSIDKHIMNYKTFRSDVDPQITSDECKKLSALQIQIQQNETLGNLTGLNSRVLIGPRTPPPLILLKPFKKRSLQNKQNEKT